jgi:hypothetical protein
MKNKLYLEIEKDKIVSIFLIDKNNCCYGYEFSFFMNSLSLLKNDLKTYYELNLKDFLKNNYYKNKKFKMFFINDEIFKNILEMKMYQIKNTEVIEFLNKFQLLEECI